MKRIIFFEALQKWCVCVFKEIGWFLLTPLLLLLAIVQWIINLFEKMDHPFPKYDFLEIFEFYIELWEDAVRPEYPRELVLSIKGTTKSHSTPPTYVTLQFETNFNPDRSQIIYINPTAVKQVDRVINKDYKKILRHYQINNYQIVYFPRLLSSKYYRRLLKYNYPWLSKTELKKQIQISPDSTSLQQLFLNAIIDEIPQCPFFLRYKEYETQKLGKENCWVYSLHKIPETDEISIRENIINFRYHIGESNQGFYSLRTPNAEDRADYDFDYSRIAEEIRERIVLMRNNGINEILIKSLFDAPAAKISKMLITRDYRIILTDYNKEIKLTALAKSVYFLFLRHPEGIVFKDLVDYRFELLEIYKNISNREDLEKLQGSIADITDPTKNSINEKCSRIKEAFLKNFDETLASNYYLQGSFGTPKRIPLDRSLITDESGLIFKFKSVFLQ